MTAPSDTAPAPESTFTLFDAAQALEYLRDREADGLTDEEAELPELVRLDVVRVLRTVADNTDGDRQAGDLERVDATLAYMTHRAGYDARSGAEHRFTPADLAAADAGYQCAYLDRDTEQTWRTLAERHVENHWPGFLTVYGNHVDIHALADAYASDCGDVPIEGGHGGTYLFRPTTWSPTP